MKRFLILFALALLAGPAAWAQTKSWQVTENGWGKIDRGISVVYARPERGMGEINIPRWRKVSGTLTIDFDKKEANLLLSRGKDKRYYLMTESAPHETRDGWTYVEYEALDENNAGCRFWLCKHESGTERLLTLYPFWSPDTIYGYRLSSSE